jgi:hypothetical protein
VEKGKFAAILPVIVSGLTNKIIEDTGISEDEAFEKLYNSELYTALENEKTKVWYYSVHFLFDLYQNEMTTGKLELPDF